MTSVSLTKWILRSSSAVSQSFVSTASIGGHTIHSLLSVYEAIHAASPNAKIYVGGYPKLFGSSIDNFTANTSVPGGALCGLDPGTVSYDDAQWMNAEADALNNTINTAVDAAHGNGIDITFVPASFGGHTLCDSGSPWLYGVLLDSSYTPLPGSVHPDENGQIFGYESGFSTFIG